MATGKVTQRQILEELRGLEPGRWVEVLDFIGYLKHRARPPDLSLFLHVLLARYLPGVGPLASRRFGGTIKPRSIRARGMSGLVREVVQC